MKNVLLRLREYQEEMTASEKAIADYIIKNPSEVIAMNVRQLANKTYTSPSTIIRLCRRIDMSGYREMQKNLLIGLSSLGEERISPSISKKKQNAAAFIKQITEFNIQTLLHTMHLQDEDKIDSCIDLILKSKTILLFGIGSSYYVAKDAYLKFLRLDKSCIANEDWHAQLLQARNSKKEDVAIIFSYSGQTIEMIKCLEVLRKNQTPVIAVTGHLNSPIAKNADFPLFVAADEPLFRNGASASRISQLNIVDILYYGFLCRQYDHSISQITKTHISKE